MSVVDKDGKPVPDAVVVVEPTNKLALPRAPLPMQAAINQEKMQFIPAVTLAAVGTKVRFSNSDPGPPCALVACRLGPVQRHPCRV